MAGDISRENGKHGGRPRLEATKLREALYRKVEERADELSDVIIARAIEGDVPAWREIADRVFGKPQASVDVTSGGKELGVILYPTKDEGALETDTAPDGSAAG